MTLLRRIDFGCAGAKYRPEPVRIDIAENPGNLRPDSERLAAASHLPSIDPDRQIHIVEDPRYLS